MAGGGTNSCRQKRRGFLRGRRAMELTLAEGRIFRFFKSDILVVGVAWRKSRERFAALHLPPVLTA
jgi:hypothetical protein